jgi:predicted dithiol-disulfide oxidoreductase (DUF899 family)
VVQITGLTKRAQVKRTELKGSSQQVPRHLDFMWPLWAVLDCTPGGRRSEWEPKLAYS